MRIPDSGLWYRYRWSVCKWIIIIIPRIKSFQRSSDETFIELNQILFLILCWTCGTFQFMASSKCGAVLRNLIFIFLRMKERREIACWLWFMKEHASLLTHKGVHSFFPTKKKPIAAIFQVLFFFLIWKFNYCHLLIHSEGSLWNSTSSLYPF